MIEYFKMIGSAGWAIAQGLGVTFRTMWKPSCTVHYPTDKLVPFEKFRGALLFDADVCISCNLCVKACPSACIQLENATNPETKKKIEKVDWYTIDFGKCNFCRLCEEACPTKPKSVWHSLDYEVVFYSRDEMVRCWKAGFKFIGSYWDRKAKAFKDPLGQVQIQDVQARR